VEALEEPYEFMKVHLVHLGQVLSILYIGIMYYIYNIHFLYIS